jgi:putative DNA primase/helicase
MHLIGAHMAGTGKSYLVDAFAVIATGRLCPVITALKSAEETEKRLGAIILSGIPMISLDNTTHDLGGEFLCQIAERPMVKVRILGHSETPDCEVHTAVYATGNNITFKGEWSQILVDSKAEQDWTRCISSFKGHVMHGRLEPLGPLSLLLCICH